jgi:flagellar biogenesis protein FliO
MRRLLVIVCAVFVPALAWGETAVTGLQIESTEREVRVVIALDEPGEVPAHRLMRDDRCLRLRFVDVVTEGLDESVEDETLRRVRVIYYRNRTVVRMDPRTMSAVDLLERAEVQPHPRGLVVVIQRSDREQQQYRAARQPPEPTPTTARERASTEEDEEEQDREAGANGAGSPDEPVASERADRRAPEREAETPAAAAAATKAPTPSRSNVASAAGAGEGGSSGTGGRSVRAATLVAFMVFLGGIAWYVKRRRGKGGVGRPTPRIDVVSAKRIGPRQSLLLIEVGGKTLLVGATEKGMSRLATIEAESLTEELAEGLDDERFELESAEEYAPVEPKKRSNRAELERELKRSGITEKETVSSIGFAQAYRGASSGRPAPTGLTDLLVAARQSSKQQKAETPAPSIGSVGGISNDAVEGLLRLRQMADDSPAIESHINGHNNRRAKGTANGDMSLAALESLLLSRQAN